MLLHQIEIIVILLLLLRIGTTFACGRAEYRIGEECCPMCSSGTRVHKHCTEYTSTSCIPCIEGTYLDEPNGRITCFACTTCDAGIGLKVKKACTTTSDAICEPLEGYYCKDKRKDSCIEAQRQSSCKPGQYINQTGTSFRDTTCSDCTGKTYSNGTLLSCHPHTICEFIGLKQMNPGTHSADTECGEPSEKLIIIIITTVLVAGCALVILSIYLIYKKQQQSTGKTESGPEQETLAQTVTSEQSV